ncbi:putative alcohol dehydrogenase [Cercophora newfieldiana]|uniref:Alcohol dehydrogenase n=1 Tax=Cercophora newfieldiana TaxID=92897 RepID=A0AA40CVT4_9PEZI|nr:putative alcohol dehydrogenase [Cercophora newfieldiana]
MASSTPENAPPPLPTHHRAIIYDKPGHNSTAVVTVPTPRPSTGELLVKITHSGVCSSDHGLMLNTWSHLPPTPTGQIGGHEGIGHIVAFGPDTSHPNLRIGSRVGIKWIASVCGSCIACFAGRDSMCAGQKISGFYTPGTFQEYVVARADYVTPIPEGVDSAMAAPLLCGGVTVYAGLKKSGAQAVGFVNPLGLLTVDWRGANPRQGEWIVVSGAGGGLGHLAVQIASKGMGLRVIGIDHGEKEALVRSLGAEAFFDVTKYSRDRAGSEALAADVKAVTTQGMGAASVIVCAGANAAYAQALSFLGFGGSLVCLGFPEGGAPVPIPDAFPGNIIARELRILGSAVGNRKEAIEALEMAARGVVKTHFVLEPPSKLTDVFERMEKMELKGRAVIDLGKD